MAMLAEYNTKKPRYNAVRAHTNANWAKETNSWGLKMLQKMGWSEGKGLGVDEAGTTEPLHIAFKSDARGLGHSILEGDKAVAQQKDFDALLATLSQKDDTEKAPEVVEERTPKSLELMSQKSRARVHYRKFTRGKDLSRASSKDLASILGVGTDIVEKKVELDSVVPAVGPALEIKLLKNSGSSVDYFKNLFELKKKKAQLENSDQLKNEDEKSSEEVTDEDDNSPSNNSILNGTLDKSSSTGRRKSVTWGDVEVSFVSKYIKDMVDTSTESVNETSTDMPQDTEAVEQCLENGSEKNKKKKKKRKNGDLAQEAQDDTMSTYELAAEVDECSDQPKKKKKKNKKTKNETEIEEINGDSLDCSPSLESSNDNDNTTPKKKKKKSKDKSRDLNESISTTETFEDKEATASSESDNNSSSVKSKKKKLKHSDSNDNHRENVVEVVTLTDESENKKERKEKKKKRRLSEVEDSSEIQILDESINLTSSKKKKKKQEEIPETNTPEDTPTEGKKKKKLKSVEALNVESENEVITSLENSNENASVESEKKKKKKKKHEH